MTIDEDDFVRIPPVIAPENSALGYRVPEGHEVPEGWTNVDVYWLAPEELSKFVWASVSIQLGFGLVGGAVLGGLAAWTTGTETLERIASGLLAAACILGTQAFFAVRGAMKMRRTWGDYRLLISNEGFMLREPERPTRWVEGHDIQWIAEEVDAFRVGLRHGTYIRISKRVVNASRLRERLQSQWGIRNRESWTTFMGSVVKSLLQFTLVFGSIAVASQTRSLWVAVACLVVCSAVGVTYVWGITRIANAALWMRLGSWACAVLPPLAVAWYTFLLFLRWWSII